MLHKSLILGCLLVICSCKNISKPENETPDYMEKAKAIHNRILTLDTHCDINVKHFTDSINYTQDLNTQVTLPKLKAGGLDVVWFSVYTGQDSLTDKGYQMALDNAMAKFNAIHKLVEDLAPDQIALATTSEEARHILNSGKKVAMIGVENAYPIGLDITRVETFYNLGARYMSLAHNGHSQLADSNTGEKDGVWLHHGLSDLGKAVIKEMNRLGIMIDVSHPSKEAMRQMIQLSKAPLIASHSSARALCDHSRNLDDEQLEWMKNNGGVVQTVAFAGYLNSEKVNARSDIEIQLGKEIMDSLGVKWIDKEAISTLPNTEREVYYEYWDIMTTLVRKKLEKMKAVPPAVNVSDLVDHIDYLVEKMGIKHVGISSDFDGGGGIEGWYDASETLNVTLELVKRGYTEDEIAMLWGGNLLRVLDEVQAIAKTLH
ncbi:dipeptidase [Aestuariivivens sediminis]|uniref:dipeptidase n=1 Tax=Aestuariivivens sediminis TaxID=2913557 RepID=UPI001F5762B7|nr:dipeptidase [Aestuariivivens sediminis]